VNADELFEEWKARRRGQPALADFADRVMGRVRAARAPARAAAAPRAAGIVLKAAAIIGAAILWGCKLGWMVVTVLEK
jgi:hypothetical protein